METLNDQVVAQWSATQMQKASLLAFLESWSEDQLRFAPEGEWNSLQIIEHIMLSEAGTLSYLLKKTRADPAELPGTDEEQLEKGRELNSALKSESKFKAPPILGDPGEGRSLEVLAAEWSRLRMKWRAFLEELDPAFQQKQVFRHPYAGPLNLEQAMAFIANHILHHRYQLERLAAAYKGLR